MEKRSRWQPDPQSSRDPRPKSSAVFSRNPYRDWVPEIQTEDNSTAKRDDKKYLPFKSSSSSSFVRESPSDVIVLQRGRSMDDEMNRQRSRSVPRISRPITSTAANEKRTQFNLERIQAITAAAVAKKRERDLDLTSPPRSTSAASGCKTWSRPTTPSDFFSTKKTPSKSVTAKVAKNLPGNKAVQTGATTGHSFINARSLKEVLNDLVMDFEDENNGHKKREGIITTIRSRDLAAAKVQFETDDKRSHQRSSKDKENQETLISSRGESSKKITDITFKLNLAVGRKPREAVTSTPDSPTARCEPDSTVHDKMAITDRAHTPLSRAKRGLGNIVSAGKDGKDKETKTSITVGVRLRPFSVQEKEKGDAKRSVYVDEERNAIRVTDKQRTHEFEFTHVFDSFDPFPYHDQEHVYKKIGRPILDHSLEGYNSCLFAYGSTGSGKTYSMTGIEGRLDYEGVIPRLIRELFYDMALGSTVSATYIEVYNEEIFNLLETTNVRKFPYRVREHPVYGPYIPSLAATVIESCEELISLWSFGNIKRAKAATAANERSSRSHAILRITVEQKYPSEAVASSPVDSESSSSGSDVSIGQRLISTINLVDLAGSERVAAAQTTGDRFREGTAINKSLLTLGKIISQLSSCTESQRSRVHVSYRDSILTFLLKESLGGNSKTCMLATVSPASSQVEETISTLRYAAKTSKIINTVKINEDPRDLRIKNLEQLLLDVVSELEEQRKRKRDSPAETSCTSEEECLRQRDSRKTKESSTQYSKRETKDSGVVTENREPKRKMLKRVFIPSPPKSTFLRDIQSICDDILELTTKSKPVVIVKAHTKNTAVKSTAPATTVSKKSSFTDNMPSPIGCPPRPRSIATSQANQDAWGAESQDSSQTNPESYVTALDIQENNNPDCTSSEHKNKATPAKNDDWGQEGDNNAWASTGDVKKDEKKNEDFDWGTGIENEKKDDWSSNTVKASDEQQDNWGSDVKDTGTEGDWGDNWSAEPNEESSPKETKVEKSSGDTSSDQNQAAKTDAGGDWGDDWC